MSAAGRKRGATAAAAPATPTPTTVVIEALPEDASSAAASTAKRFRADPIVMAHAAELTDLARPDLAGGVSATETEAFRKLSSADREALVAGVARYCFLKWSGGTGLIEEADIKKLPLPGLPKAGARLPLSHANLQLGAVFGLEILNASKTRADPRSRGDMELDKTKYCLRLLPPLATAAASEGVAVAAADGLTVEQRGLLALVLSFVLLDGEKAVREDVLFGRLRAVGVGTGGEDIEGLGWQHTIRNVFTRAKYLERRLATGEDDLWAAAGGAGSAASGGGGAAGGGASGVKAAELGSDKYKYTVGPRTRATVPLIGVLNLATSVTGAEVRGPALRQALGREWNTDKDATTLVEVTEIGDEPGTPAGGGGGAAGGDGSGSGRRGRAAPRGR